MTRGEKRESARKIGEIKEKEIGILYMEQERVILGITNKGGIASVYEIKLGDRI